jgi:hypothetical protein
MELLICLGLLLGGLGLVLLVLGLFSPRGHDTKHDELLTFLTGDPAASAAMAVVGMALSLIGGGMPAHLARARLPFALGAPLNRPPRFCRRGSTIEDPGVLRGD